MKRSLIFAVFITALFTLSVLNSRDFRVQKIPNGSRFSCANCHVNPLGGGARNQFGQEVEKHVTPGGTQNFWSAQLASLDSDGDGFSNGEELQDPNGFWAVGQSNPGDFSQVTNPGDPNSKPIMASAENEGIPLSYRLLNNYPNPFNPSTSIGFEIPQSEFVSLKIYDIKGELVKTLFEGSLPAGKFEKVWDGKYQSGASASSGIYIYNLSAGKFNKSANMLLLK